MASTVEREMEAGAARVWEVLADGWSYPAWVVGAARMRAVDEGWPAEGARLHHSVGAWPLLIHDTTRVLESHRPHRLSLDAGAWLLGRARIDYELESIGRGRSRVRMHEAMIGRAGRMVPEPVNDQLLRWRNGEVLQRLAAIAERRTA